MPSEDLMRHTNEHVKNRASRLSFNALKQWKSNDIPSIDHCAIIIVVYEQNRKFIDNFIVNG